MWEHEGEGGGVLHREVRIPYKAVCVTERRWSGCKRGGVKDEGMAAHKKHRAEKALQDGARGLNAET